MPREHPLTTSDSPVAGEQFADHPVVFFDGVCGLCNHAVNYILARDRAAVFRFAPLQGETAARLLPSEDIASLKSLVLMDGRGVHRRSTAIWRILTRLPGGSRWLGRMLAVVPYPLRDVGYRLVSACRYRLFGRHDVCRMPSAEERARFLP